MQLLQGAQVAKVSAVWVGFLVAVRTTFSPPPSAGDVRGTEPRRRSACQMLKSQTSLVTTRPSSVKLSNRNGLKTSLPAGFVLLGV